MNNLLLLYIKRLSLNLKDLILLLISITSFLLILVLVFNFSYNIINVSNESLNSVSYGNIINTIDNTTMAKLEKTNYSNKRNISLSQTSLAFQDINLPVYTYDYDGFYLPNEIKSFGISKVSNIGLIIVGSYCQALSEYLNVKLEDIKEIPFNYEESNLYITDIIDDKLYKNIPNLLSYGILLYDNEQTNIVFSSYDYIRSSDTKIAFDEISNGSSYIETLESTEGVYKTFSIIAITIFSIILILSNFYLYSLFSSHTSNHKQFEYTLIRLGCPYNKLFLYKLIEYIIILTISFIFSIILYIPIDLILNSCCDFSFLIIGTPSYFNLFRSSFLIYPVLYLILITIFSLYYLLRTKSRYRKDNIK